MRRAGSKRVDRGKGGKRGHGADRSGAAVFAAVADPIRRSILDALRAGDLPAGQIAEAFPVSRPAVSRHLRVLRRAGLVRQEAQGRLRVYRLDPAPLRHLDSWLTSYRTFWAARLMDLKDYVERTASGDGAASAGADGGPPRASEQERNET